MIHCHEVCGCERDGGERQVEQHSSADHEVVILFCSLNNSDSWNQNHQAQGHWWEEGITMERPGEGLPGAPQAKRPRLEPR